MKLSVVSNTGIPAVLPEDPAHFSIYGSEVQNAVLVKGLAQRGHEIRWYAPGGSTTFTNDPNVEFYPITDSKGQHLPDERLEIISARKTSDILDTDFLIDLSKQAHVSEELEMWDGWTKSAQWRSGYQDWKFPMRITPRHVTHCQYFKEHFEKNGHPAEVARFGLSDFWCPYTGDSRDWIQPSNPEWVSLPELGYFLYPHRPNPEKGALIFQKLAREFKDYKFVVQTGLKFEDHFREWNAFKESCKDLPNVVFIELPHNLQYQLYRRSLMRNAAAVLSLFDESNNGYMDTGGLVGAEAVRCGTPLMVTRGQGSEELFGSLEDKGVIFVDSFESAKRAIKFNEFQTRPTIGNEFMPVKDAVEDWERIIQKWL